MKAYKAMLKTELKISLRGMDMVIFAICMPVVIMAILGIIYGSKPAYEGANFTFLAQSFGAVSAIAICAGGVMGLPLVIADYRNKKILKRFKVTPTSPALILVVHASMYALYSLASLILVYITASLFGYRFDGSWLQFMGAFLLVMVSMFSIDLLVGGVAPNIKTASVLASVLYFPMLIFSGATLPYEIMPAPLQRVADIMPLTQGIKLLKSTSLGTSEDILWLPIAVMIGLAIICTAFAISYFKWE
ncbi:MAG: ABC transporter permease [Clostridiaceae bacterium]|nr:ABC transporter permease [Clostridiaceae bacterium]